MFTWRGALVEKNKSKVLSQEQVLDAKDIERQLDMIDQRLDNIEWSVQLWNA
jgi:hypothetical protein